MQADVDDVLEQDAAASMDQALGAAGRPGGEQHVGGVVERQPGEHGLGAVRQRLLEGDDDAVGARGVAQPGGRVSGVVGDEHRGQRREPGHDVDQRVGPVDLAPGPAVGGRDDEDPRLELSEPVQHERRAELGRGAAHDGADGEGAERRDRRIEADRQHEPDPVARLHPV